MPMADPGERFYKWLTSANFRYPKHRWEWNEAASLLREMAQDGPISVLDAGCGEGRFLEQIAEIPGVAAQGFDQNFDVVEAARARGLDVYHGDLSTVGLHDLCIDVITLFHVVEHVSDPIDVLERARDCLNQRGIIMFSVPLSPMSYEHAWPDPFNMPPHHLTRWSLRSLTVLGDRLGMGLRLSVPQAAPLPARVLRSLVLQAGESAKRASALSKAMNVLRFVATKPTRLVAEVSQQLRRERYAGCALPDVVLVRLEKY
ncbi:class I SAM-dependent methyltransferase [Luteimonas sp. M1R5S18]|uniref:Class I SAM-dependent methyltransferase n=1 Tax=Luteimonas rhizosphaericola TaxID=3042024 RepID=A0ABT6JKW3_9GAMM|nr:class I SAM-dependent methyltransferase [Luteimonas rhizosphaericola]MDH5831322.1 class I SAM-dependent methyltransferase [Luteimonas rhizosphaericola]